ncbi:fibrinogen-like protein 1 [Hypomesus transpacificus]|uniref:fibrinogen-like protein 1 n=1 Tax=Hypomesus transpacificus TaxID=137520 RepID=UPI001F073744|nr:fibrinogen-like protein 1 [Hypomesus transpacificus]XP_046880891.1 fibrinogen-like protein 1 [Hypomesus transpacificus]
MIPLGSLSMLPLLSLCVGAVLSPPEALSTCPHPPCRDSLVAAPPIRPGTGAGMCEGRSGASGCRVVAASPSSSDSPLRVEHRQELRQVQTKMGDVSDRLVQLQSCMRSLQEPGATRGQGAQPGGDTLGAILALMASVLTECDLHCHSQALRAMAKRLEGAAVGREGEKDLLLLLRSITQHSPTVAPSARQFPQDCAEIYRVGIKENGIYTIQPDPQRPALEASCDMETAGGGWTVFQTRRDGLLDFNRTWQEYQEGFGSPQGEHWLGNAALHGLTSSGQYQLRIQLEDWHQQRRHATYNTFRVASETQRYRLTAREYSGDAGNSLSYSKRYNHDGRAFSTNDRDHDRYTAGNCAQYYGAGWWFDACLAANLNGRYYRGRYSGLTNGIYWGTWYILTDSRSGERYSFKSVEMKTRPRDF